MVGPVKRPSLSPAGSAVKAALGAGRAARAGRAGDVIVPLKKTRLAEEIADRIRALMLEGAYPAGRPLPGERDLAKRFGVGRGSVRDAFRVLETIGLIETRHGQGTFPRELDVDRLVVPLASVLAHRSDLQDELHDVRRMFEPAVARVAALRATPDDVAALERIVGEQRRKAKGGRSTISEDTAFHAALARATRNRVLERLMETLNGLLVESRALTLRQKGRPERSIRGHENVVAAIRRRDADGAADAMHAHIDEIAALLKPRNTNPHKSPIPNPKSLP